MRVYNLLLMNLKLTLSLLEKLKKFSRHLELGEEMHMCSELSFLLLTEVRGERGGIGTKCEFISSTEQFG